MGLGSKLGQKNIVIQQQLNDAQELPSVGGYNSQNIKNLQSSAPLTQQEVLNAHNNIIGVRNETNKKLSSMRTHLVKPTPKTTGNPSKDLINTMVCDKMWRIVCLKELHNFFTQDQLQTLVDKACLHDYQALQLSMEIPTLDMTTDIAVLGLYNIILYLDDSGSMSTEESHERMTRWNLLKEVTKTISFWGSLMDVDGICVRFFNNDLEGNCITTPNDVSTILNQVSPNASTPMGANMKNKVFNKMIHPFLMNQQIDRPVLIATVTDGIPDNKNDVVETIKYCRNACLRTKYGQNAVAFSFSQIGSDRKAAAWLGEIDVHPEVGHIIDCTSDYEIEREECGPNFTESAWLVKLLIGAIDPAYDQADEQPRNSIPVQQMQQRLAPPPPQPPLQQQMQQIPMAQTYVLPNNIPQGYQPITGVPVNYQNQNQI
jgi:hypothetical protein